MFSVFVHIAAYIHAYSFFYDWIIFHLGRHYIFLIHLSTYGHVSSSQLWAVVNNAAVDIHGQVLV